MPLTNSVEPYIGPYLSAVSEGDVQRMNMFLEEHPSIVENERVALSLSVSYTLFLRKEPSYARSLYDLVGSSEMPSRAEHLKRFDTLDMMQELKDRLDGMGIPARLD